jgi:hypothetical protein
VTNERVEHGEAARRGSDAENDGGRIWRTHERWGSGYASDECRSKGVKAVKSKRCKRDERRRRKSEYGAGMNGGIQVTRRESQRLNRRRVIRIVGVRS